MPAQHRTDTAAAPPVHAPQAHDARPATPEGDVTARTRHAAAGQHSRAYPRTAVPAAPLAPPEPAASAEDRQEPHRARTHPDTSPWAEDLGTPTDDEPAVTVRIGRIVVPPPPARHDTGPRRPAVTLPSLAEYLREGGPR